MSEKKTVAIVGLGNRGSEYFGLMKFFYGKQIKVNAICDTAQDKLKRYGKACKVSEDMRFKTADELFKKGLIADAIIIATPDRDHYRTLKMALETGYKIILCEKPLSHSIDETRELAQLAEEKGAKVMVCHVMRYTTCYLRMKRIIESGELGQIISIDERENVGYFHFAHSYVRGNWHKEAESAPSILAKCCHDLDLVYWYADSEPKTVESRGGLYYFNKEHAPCGATEFCMNGCTAKKNCPYDAEMLYTTLNPFKMKFIRFMPTTVFKKPGLSRKEKKEFLKTGDYGKCVFLNDNDVCDYQEVNIEFENGILGKVTMTAFGPMFANETRIVGTKGELISRKGKVTKSIYGKGDKTVFHGFFSLIGDLFCDIRCTKAFCKQILGTLEDDKDVTYISATVGSHLMAHMAEESRKSNSEKQYNLLER